MRRAEPSGGNIVKKKFHIKTLMCCVLGSLMNQIDTLANPTLTPGTWANVSPTNFGNGISPKGWRSILATRMSSIFAYARTAAAAAESLLGFIRARTAVLPGKTCTVSVLPTIFALIPRIRTTSMSATGYAAEPTVSSPQPMKVPRGPGPAVSIVSRLFCPPPGMPIFARPIPPISSIFSSRAISAAIRKSSKASMVENIVFFTRAFRAWVPAADSMFSSYPIRPWESAIAAPGSL